MDSSNKNIACTQGRGRSRGRSRGRGRGRGAGAARASSGGGSSGSQNNDVLEQIREQGKETRKHMTQLSLQVRRKRVTQLDRVLLPVAPQRKRSMKNPSPERRQLIFVSAHEEPVTVPPREEPEPEYEIAVCTTSEVKEEPSAIEYCDVVWPDTARPSTYMSTVGISDRNFATTVTDWMDTILDSDDDLDIDGLPLPITSRTVTDYPADNNGLTTDLIAASRAREVTDDMCIREMAASNTCFDFNWTNNRQTFTGERESFTGMPGPTFPVTNDMTPVDIFLKMFDDDFFNLLVTETNRYADQTMSYLRQNPNAPKYARCLTWTPTDRNEMAVFLAVMILQGLYPKVNEEAYFNFDGFGTTPYFGRIMSYNRYYLLKTFMHFIDNTATEDTRKLNKIRPIIDYFNGHFASLYSLSQEIALDESLLKWHGRLSFAQKITSIAAQVGVKTYELCESSTGYLWAFRVYTGEDGPNRTRLTGQDGQNDNQDGQDRLEQDEIDDSREGHGEGIDDDQDGLEHDNFGSSGLRPQNATSKIVYDLVEPLLNKGHTLIMDNFYNSPLLARCLKNHNTDVFGTLRLTREFVPDALKTLSKTDMRQGEVAVSYCSDLVVILWRDANLVSMISTYHPLQVGTSEKFNRAVYKPAIVMDYNKSMGGIDRKNQFLASQPLERHTIKVWYKKLFRRLYNVAIFNCHIIFTSNTTHSTISHRNFRRMLAENLLKIHRQIDLLTEPRLYRHRQTNKLTVHRATRPFVEENHFPVKTGSTATRCWICARKKRPTRTSYKCEECDINLCIVGCFKEYHKPIQEQTSYGHTDVPTD